MRGYVLSLMGFGAIALLSVMESMATLVPNLDLPALTDRADLVVVGKVLDVRQAGPIEIQTNGGSVSGHSMIAALGVEKTLKGKAESSTISFGFALPDIPSGYGGIAAGEFGVFFLHDIGARREILDPYYPFVIASPDAPGTQGGTCLDKVTAELAYVFASPTTSPATRAQAVWALDTLLTPMATLALKNAAQDKDLTVRAYALAALLKRNDISVLDTSERILLSPEEKLDENLVIALAQGIQFGVKDPKAIPALTRLLHARNINTRRGAAAALRNTGDKAAIEPLVRALEDSDPDVRYSGVIGLAEITRQTGEWAPAYDTFLKDQDRYLRYWRDWAKSGN